jgi:hypothetical protein
VDYLIMSGLQADPSLEMSTSHMILRCVKYGFMEAI